MNSNPIHLQSIIETLEHRWHLAATVNVTTLEPLAVREDRDAGMFVVTRRDNLQSDLTVPLVVRGTARNGIDYGRIGDRVTIPAGERSVGIPVRPVNNTLQSRYVTLTVDPPAAYASSSNTAVVYVVSNVSSSLPAVQAVDFVYPAIPIIPAGGSVTRTPVFPDRTPGTDTGGTVVSAGEGQIFTIPTGTAIPIGGVPGDTPASPATGVGTRPVTTVLFDPITGLPISSTTPGGLTTGVPVNADPGAGVPIGGTGTGVNTGTETGTGGGTPIGGLPGGDTTGGAIGGVPIDGIPTTTGGTGTVNDITTPTNTTGTIADDLFDRPSDLVVDTRPDLVVGGGASFGQTPISNGLRAGVPSDSLFIS